MDVLRQAGIAALVAMFVAILPIFAGLAYLIRPSEQRLALMRPLSLASLFAGLSGLLLGLINMLRYYWMHETEISLRIMAVGLAESLVSLLLAFGALTFAWLCVAIRFWSASARSNGGTAP
jgi:hypothetical protein